MVILEQRKEERHKLFDSLLLANHRRESHDDRRQCRWPRAAHACESDHMLLSLIMPDASAADTAHR